MYFGGGVASRIVVCGSVGERVEWEWQPPTNRLLRAFFVLLSERFLLAWRGRLAPIEIRATVVLQPDIILKTWN